jgi:hypothetical protein
MHQHTKHVSTSTPHTHQFINTSTYTSTPEVSTCWCPRSDWLESLHERRIDHQKSTFVFNQSDLGRQHVDRFCVDVLMCSVLMCGVVCLDEFGLSLCQSVDAKNFSHVEFINAFVFFNFISLFRSITFNNDTAGDE